MKKKLIYILSCVVALLPATLAKAQTCSENFTVKTQITNSTCQANGQIVVTLEGETTNIFDVQYGLSASGGGLTVPPSNNNVFSNLPPGKYDLTVQAFCQVDINYNVLKIISNLQVGGNYKVPQVSFNASASRNSYSGCPMGIIALNVTDGSGNFTFTLVSAPTGAPYPDNQTLTPVTKNGNVYTLPGQNWPAGSYQIQVNDGCYSAMANFSLSVISGFPAFNYTGTSSYMGFRPDVDNAQTSACNVVGWLSTSSTLANNSDFLRYFNDGLYEINIAPIVGGVAQTPNANTWVTWTNYTSATVWLTLPNSIDNYYSTGTNTLAVYTRVKGCSNASTYLAAYIKKPSYIPIVSTYCDYLMTYPWTDYDGVFCYPLTLTITQGGNTVYTKSNWLYRNDQYTHITGINYSSPYTITFTDKNGAASISTTQTPTFSYYPSPVTYCNDYNIYHSIFVSGMPTNCYDWVGVVKVWNSSGTLIGLDTLYTTGYKLSSFKMQYGATYSITVEYPNGVNSIYSNNFSISQAATPTLSLYYADACAVNSGNLQIYTGISDYYQNYWPAGTTYTITGPTGFTTITGTTTTPPAYYYYPPGPNSSTYIPLPPGNYSLTYDLGGGGCPRTVPFNNPGEYSYTNFGYDSLQTCSGMQIMPKGVLTYQGVNQATYFRLMSGPAGSGYNTSVITGGTGGSFTLSAPGTYVLGIMQSNSVSGCAIATVEIKYDASPLSLDANFTSAYVCVNGTTGNISLRAINGVPPYKYELWNAGNTVKYLEKTENGSVYFYYGTINTTYTVHVTDGCGNSFNQQVTLSDLETARIVYSPHNSICDGGTIQLRCVTLGTTKYYWTGPNGFTSEEQYPTIENATSAMSGWYKVEVQPEYCGTSVKDSTYITVSSVLIAGAVSNNQEVCMWTAPAALSSETTGGSGNYVYQWQSSPTGAGGSWTDIPGAGAKGETYLPPATSAGTVYYRKTTNDLTCGTSVSSAAIKVVVRACPVPVNPNLRSMPRRSNL